MTIFSQKSLQLWTFEEISFEISRLADYSFKDVVALVSFISVLFNDAAMRLDHIATIIDG